MRRYTRARGQIAVAALIKTLEMPNAAKTEPEMAVCAAVVPVVVEVCLFDAVSAPIKIALLISAAVHQIQLTAYKLEASAVVAAVAIGLSFGKECRRNADVPHAGFSSKNAAERSGHAARRCRRGGHCQCSRPGGP